MDTPTKICSKCGKEFPETAEYFIPGKRYKNGLRPQCKACYNQMNQVYRAAHPDMQRVSTLAYKYRHLEETRQKDREIARVRRAQSPEKHREANRRAWHKNKHKYITKTHRREARKRALPDTLTTTEWQRALEYFSNCCAACGRPRGLWHVLAQDHWIPISRGGGYEADNIIPLCHGIDGCNNSKADREANEWLVWKFGKRRAKQIAKRIAKYFEWVKQNR